MADGLFVNPQNFANTEVINTHRERRKSAKEIAAATAFAPVGIVAGALDTIGQSVGVIDDNDFENFFGALNSTAGDLYSDNKTGYRFAGDIGSLFVGAGAATKLLRSGSFLSRGLQASGKVGQTIDRVIAIDQNRVDNLVSEFQKFSALAGQAGAPSTTGFSGAKALKLKTRVAQAANDLRGGIAAEAYLFGAMNESQLFFPEGQSTSDMVFMSTVGLAFGGGVGQLFVNPALKKAGASSAKAALTRGDIYSADAGLDLVTAAKVLEETAQGVPANILKEIPETQGTFNNLKSSARNIASRAVGVLSGKKPIGLLSGNVPQSDALVDSVVQVAKTNPKMVANALSIEPAAALNDFHNKSANAVNKLTKERADLNVELSNSPSDIRFNQIKQSLDTIDEQLKNLQGDSYPVRVNSIGQMTSNPKQETIFDTSNLKIQAVDPAGHGSSRRIFYAQDGAKDRTLGFTVDGRILRGNREITSLSGLSIRERTKPMAAMGKALRHMKKVLADDDIKIRRPKRITRNSSHLTLDYVLEAQERYGNGEDQFTAISKIFDLSDFDSVSDLKLAAYNAKFREYKKLIKEQQSNLRSGNDVYNSETVGQALNLRFSDDVNTRNFGLQWFEDVRQSGAKSVGDTLEEAMQDFQQHVILGSSKGTAAKYLANKGKGFERLLDTDLFAKLDKPQEPFTMIVSKGSRVDTGLLDHRTMVQVKTTFEEGRDLELSDKVARTRGAEMLAQMDVSLKESPELMKAVQDGSRNLSQDAVDQPLVDKLGQLTPFSLNFVLRGVEGADSAGIIADIWQRQAKTFAAKELRENTNALNSLRAKGNEESLALYLHYHSAMQQGWKLDEEMFDVAGRIKLLADDEQNVKIAKQMGLDEVPEFMPEPVIRDGTPLVLDDLAQAALQEIRRFSDMRWSMDNVLSNHLGRKGMQYRQGHTIEPSRYGQEMAFITDEMGSVVDYTSAGTVREARRLAAKRIEERTRELRDEGKQGTFGTVTREEVGAYKQAHHQAWNSGFIDVSDAWQQTSGKKAAGARSGLYTDGSFVDGQLLEVSEMFTEAGQKFIATKFSGQLENVRALSDVANVQKQGLKNLVTGETGQAFDDVYEQWAHQLLNTSTRHRGSLYGSLGLTIEHAFDSTIGKAFDALRDLPTGRSNAGTNKRLQELSKKLTEQNGFNPNEYAIRMSERSVGGKMPPQMLGIMRGAAGFTQAMALKFFEVGHAALTTASIMTTVPHNVEWMRRGVNESVQAFKTRVGIAGDLLDDDYAVPNASKLAMTTVAKHLKGDYAEVVEKAKNLGYLDSQIAEFVNELTSPKKTKAGKFASKLGDYAGLVSGKSEDYARTISFLTGYEMFSKQGKIGDNLAMGLANDFANRVIADYRPHQRAEVFKGATGIPLAMFQTFAINYFQRLLQNVENKQWRALGVQYGTQAFVFGGESIPGYALMNEAVLETWDEKSRPEDLVKEGFNKGLSDVMLYGTLGNLPKLLGADDGLAFHTRGEMSVPRNISFLNFGETPVVQLVKRSGQAMRDGFKAAGSNADVGGLAKLQESLVYAIPNRPTKGLFEYIQGHSTNQRGEIINNEIGGLYDFAQRISGLKPIRDADKAKALWRDRETELSQRNAMASLSGSVEAVLRKHGSVKDAGVEIQTIVESYYANGGTPRGFNRWYKERLLRAKYSKSDRAILKALRQGDRGQDIMRFVEE